MADLQLTIDTQKAKADLSEALKEMRNMASNPIKVDLKLTAPKNTKDILRQFRELYELADRLDKKGIDIGSNINSGKGLKNEIKDVDKYYDRLIAARKKLNKAISTAEKDQNSNKPYLNTDELNRQLDEMRTIRNRMSKEIGYIARNGTQHFNDKENTKAINQMIVDANRSKAVYEDLSEVARSAQIVPEIKADRLRNFDKLGNRLTAYYKQFGDQIQSNTELFNRYNTLMHKLNSGQFATTKAANTAFAEFRMECRKAGIEVQSFGSLLKNTFGSRVRSAMAGQGVYMIQSALREILQSSVQVDTAMTELKKVTDLTATGYNQFLEGAQQRASKLGATLTEVINATADYSRLGYNISEATMMSDSALIYTNVGDDVENIDDATSALISTMQGFNIQAEDSMSIVDKFNNVSNNYASSAGDIGEIVKRSAASMSAAGNTLEQTIALGVGANEVQQDADTVGTALKTMSMRLRGELVPIYNENYSLRDVQYAA